MWPFNRNKQEQAPMTSSAESSDVYADIDESTLRWWFAEFDTIREAGEGTFPLSVKRGQVILVNADNVEEIEASLCAHLLDLFPDVIEERINPEPTLEEVQANLAQFMSSITLEELREAARPRHRQPGSDNEVG